jgi:hypothetical protein
MSAQAPASEPAAEAPAATGHEDTTNAASPLLSCKCTVEETPADMVAPSPVAAATPFATPLVATKIIQSF